MGLARVKEGGGGVKVDWTYTLFCNQGRIAGVNDPRIENK